MEEKKQKNKSSLVSAAANETFPCMHTMEHVHKDVDVVNTEGGGGGGGGVKRGARPDEIGSCFHGS